MLDPGRGVRVMSESATATDPLRHFDGLVEGDRRSFRMYLGLTGVLVVIGVILLAVGFLVPADPSREFAGLQDLAIKLGGLCIASLAAIPLRQCLSRRERVITAPGLRAFLAARLHGAAAPEEALNEVYEQIAKLYQVRMS